MHSFPKNLKTIRSAQSLTQDQLAEKLHITRQTISSWERGRSEPDLETLGALAKVLNARVEDLIYGPKRPCSAPSKKAAFWWIVTSFAIGVTVLVLELTLFPYLDRLRVTEYVSIPFFYSMAVPQLGSLGWGIFFISVFSLWRPFPVSRKWRWVFRISGILLVLPGLLVTLECFLGSFFPNHFFLLTRFLVVRGYRTLRPVVLWIAPFLGGALLRLGCEKQN